MSERLIEEIEFRAVSPKTGLPGLDEAHKKLLAIQGTLDRLQGTLSGISSNSAFKRSVAGITDAIKTFEKGAGRGAPLKDLSKVLGFDPKDVRQYLLRETERMTQDIAASEKRRSKLKGASGAAEKKELLRQEKQWQSELTSLQKTFEGQQLKSSGASNAAKFFHGYQRAAIKQAKEPIAALQALFGGGAGAAAPAGAAHIGGITLGPGPVQLIVPADRIVATVGAGTVAAVGAGGGGRGGSTGSTKGGAGSAAATVSMAGGGALVETQVTVTSKSRRERETRSNGPGHKVDQYFKLDEEGHRVAEKEVITENAVKQQAGMVGEFKKTAKMRKELARAREKGEQDHQQAMVDDFQQVAEIRKKLAAAKEKGDKEEAQRLLAEKKKFENQIKARNRMDAARNRSDDAAARAAKSVADDAATRAAGAARASASHAGAQFALDDFVRRGGVIKSDRSTQGVGKTGPTLSREVTAEMEFGGRKHQIVATFTDTGASVKRLTRELRESREEAGLLGGDFIKNTVKVAAWSASVGVLYKSLELVGHSMTELIQIGGQMARLDQVFRGLGGSSSELTDDILRLAAANGQDGQKAMESAIQWSRLGLTRSQVTYAVKQSLVAANVAELSSAEATEKLQAIMQNYGLTVGDLGVKLGEMNQISNTFNATNADMLEGLSRTAAVAKQAGVPLEELMGIIAATVGNTGQTGANIGNAIKSVTLALSNPALQQKLRSQFQMESTGGGEQNRGMSEVLADLYVKYQHLNEVQQRSLLFQVAGRTQASRLAAMLNSYVKAQVLAINAQLNLNSAEKENEKIKDTLKSQLVGLATEWERFVVVQGNRGPVQVLTEMTEALKHLLALANTGPGSTLMTGVLGLVTAAGMKTLLTGMQLRSGGGFLSRTGAHVAQAASSLNISAMGVLANGMGGNLASSLATRQTGIVGGNANSLAGRVYVYSEALLRMGKSLSLTNAGLARFATLAGTATRTIGVGLVALRSFIVPLVIITAATWAFNRAMEAVGMSSDKAEAKLAGFNEGAQKAAAAANAYAEAANVLRTAERALSPEKGFKSMASGDQEKLIRDVSEAVGTYEPDPGKRAARQQQFRDEAEALRKQGDIARVLNMLENERNKLVEERRGQLQIQFEELKKQEDGMNEELERLSHPKGLGWLVEDFTKASRTAKILELQRRKAELGGQKAQNLVEQSTAYEDRLQYDEKHQTALKKEKLLLQSIEEIYAGINTVTAVDRSAVKVAGLEAQNEAIDRQLKLLESKDETELTTDADKEARLKALADQEKKTRGDLSEAKQLRFPGHANYRFIEQKVTAADAEAARLKEVLKDIERQRSQVNQGHLAGSELGFASRGAQRQDLLERQRANRSDIEAERAMRNMFELQARGQMGREQGRREVAGMDFGRDETEALLNKRAYAQQEIARLEMQGEKSVSERTKMLELESEVYGINNSLRDRAYTIEKDINALIIERGKEFRNSFLEAGPAEMLRKLAALKMAASGQTTMGGFLAMSPGMRGDVRMLDPRFDPRMMDLMAERQRNRGGGFAPHPEFEDAQLLISKRIGELASRLKEALPDTATYEAARNNVDKLGNSAAKAAAALETVVAVVSRFGIGMPGASSGGGGGDPIEKAGQYGGRGGAAGFTGVPVPAGRSRWSGGPNDPASYNYPTNMSLDDYAHHRDQGQSPEFAK